jgi:hypothetical protein
MAKSNENTRWQKRLDKHKKKENTRLIRSLSESKYNEEIRNKLVILFSTKEK